MIITGESGLCPTLVLHQGAIPEGPLPGLFDLQDILWTWQWESFPPGSSVVDTGSVPW